MTMGCQQRTAVVLSGGIAYAAYEVGVLKALFQGLSPAVADRGPLRPDIFVGTSMGAVNAATMVSQLGAGALAAVQFLEDVWVNQFATDPGRCQEGAVRVRGAPENYWNPAYWLRRPLQPLSWFLEDGLYLAREGLVRMADFLNSSGPLGRRALEVLQPVTPIADENFKRIVARTINLAAVRNSDRVLRVITTNWRTGKLREFGNADLTDAVGHRAIYASAAFPGIPPTLIDGEPYVDGAYLLEAPTQSAWFSGADIMHLIYIDPDIEKIPLRRFDNFIDILDKVYHIMVADMFDRDVVLARDINRGLATLARGEAPSTDEQIRGVLRLVGRAVQVPPQLPPYRTLTMHRYHPSDDLGGALGLINFDRDHIQWLIARGYRDALEHDCQQSNCLLPD
jgi:predicted acylesterase/phospholipase RssA